METLCIRTLCDKKTSRLKISFWEKFAGRLKEAIESFRISNTSVIWQKDESQNGGNKNTKHAKFSEKRMFFTP